MDGPLQENCHTYLLLSCNTYRVDSSADFKSTDSQKGYSGNGDAPQDFARYWSKTSTFKTASDKSLRNIFEVTNSKVNFKKSIGPPL